jgi:hypothetical protein
MNWPEIEALLAAEDFGDGTHPDDYDEEAFEDFAPSVALQAKMMPGAIQLARTRRRKPMVVPGTATYQDTGGKRAKLDRGTPGVPGNYTTHPYSNRNYFYQQDNTGRITKYQGRLSYVKGGRSATKKTKNKRVNDDNAHLIAHSLGGNPKFALGYVAMARVINQRGGDWYRMESYIRRRLVMKNSKVYMATKPHYPTPTMKRPDYIEVSVYFNRSPYKIKFRINTP